ncbi:MAG: hypothetical protein M0042_14300 [Nitrospiraceae bacterium]|nr:hypothetical protein [Nitrospiraceae bacterium]
MLRQISATILVLHLLLMMLVAASTAKFMLLSVGMSVAAALAVYVFLLVAYFRKRVFSPVVLAGTILYLAALLLIYGALVIGSIQIGRAVNIWFHSVVFLPGIFGAASYLRFLRGDRRTQHAGA